MAHELTLAFSSRRLPGLSHRHQCVFPQRGRRSHWVHRHLRARDDPDARDHGHLEIAADAAVGEVGVARDQCCGRGADLYRRLPTVGDWLRRPDVHKGDQPGEGSVVGGGDGDELCGWVLVWSAGAAGDCPWGSHGVGAVRRGVELST